jgi:very-short-patch-repair endonuclease
MINEVEVLKLYDDGYSTQAIAAEFDTYPNKIRRILVRNGKKLRDRGEAQKIALEQGRSVHPTKGTKRSDAVKTKISEASHKHWQSLSPQEREKRSEKAREQWYNMTEEQRDAIHTAAMEGVRKASKEGSKVEIFLRDALLDAGYETEFHVKNIIPNTDLEIDLYLPKLKTVIEIDGPTHFYPIWGEASLNKHVKADAHKSGLIISCGMNIIRVKYLATDLSLKRQRDLLADVIEKLEYIKNNKLTKRERFMELEVK